MRCTLFTAFRDLEVCAGAACSGRYRMERKYPVMAELGTDLILRARTLASAVADRPRRSTTCLRWASELAKRGMRVCY